MAGIARKPNKFPILSVCLLCAIPVVFFFSIFVGTANISIPDAAAILWKSVFSSKIENIRKSSITIVLNLRVPRIILALCAGAALGASGTVLQCLFRNPMADPYVMGISSGAAFGVSVGVVSGLTSPLLLQVSSFGGALASVFLVLFLARVAGGSGNSLVILLAGIAVSLFFSALMSLIMYLNHEQAEKIMFWTFGSISGSSWRKLATVIWLILPGVIVLAGQWKRLNLLSQGDEAARSLGINPEKTRIFLLILVSVIVAATVSVTGIIGFVGLMVPHAMRMIVGPNHKHLLPLSAMGGAIFLVLADCLARTLLAPAEIPVGIVTSLIGAPYLLIVLIFRRK